MDDVYAALQNADAAGDTASAQQLADYIRSPSLPGGVLNDRTLNPSEYDPQSGAYQQKYGPMAGRSFGQSVDEGAGKFFTDAGLGAAQIRAIGEDPTLTTKLQAQAAKSAR